MIEECTDWCSRPYALVTGLALEVRGRIAQDGDGMERALAALRTTAGAGG